MSSLTEHFQLLARYNRVANDAVLDGCAQVAPEVLSKPSTAPFWTIMGLLEHVLAADEVWLTRFQGVGAQLPPGPPPQRALAEFRAARAALDLKVEDFIAGLSEEDLDATFTTTNSLGEKMTAPLSRFIAHLFNHQTHHRGQVQLLLRDASVTGLALDLHRLMARS